MFHRTSDLRTSQIERLVRETRQVSHVTLNAANVQPLSFRDHAVLGELFIGEIKAHHICSGSSKNRNLLSPA
jgi:hypothetical protein